MTGDRAAEVAFLCLALTLPAAALLARRLPLGSVARMALLWLGIILATVALIGLVQHWLERKRSKPLPNPDSPISFTSRPSRGL